MKTLKSLIFCLVFLFGMHSNALATPNSQATLEILYVKESATGDCSSWANACDLQTALTNAGYDDEIWVAAGTYKPTVDTDPNASFQLKPGVAIYGGFPDVGNPTWADRDWVGNPTILSGDLAGNDGADFENYEENSIHVVTARQAFATPVLDGFTISGASGGGMYNEESSPTLTHMTFSNNQGGGMANWFNSNPILTDVTFSTNTASSYGGGMFNRYSSPILTDVTFSNNTAASGGGMYNHSFSSPT